MKYLGILILLSACNFTASSHRCEEGDRPRSGFECSSNIWVSIQKPIEDVGVDIHEDLEQQAVCGDGVVEGDEECDGTTFLNACTSLGYESGSLSCTDACEVDESNCRTKSNCGNATLDTGEECEEGIAITTTCQDVGDYSAGNLSCTRSCIFDTDACSKCGDGIITGEEVCDKGTLDDKTCANTLGYEATGELSCDACQNISTDSCSPIFTQISAGFGHSCALKSDGSIVCWGKNDTNQLDAPESTDFIQVGAGEDFSCGLQESGTIVCWGSNEDGKRSPPEGKFLKISLGAEHGCAIDDQNEIQCWGNDDRRSNGTDGQFDNVSVWEEHGCAIAANEITCWGRNGNDEGDVPEKDYKSVSVGLRFTCAIDLNDEVDCWGKNGNETDDPSGLFSSIDLSSFHSCGIEKDTNFAKCWGDSSDDNRVVPPNPTTQYRAISAGRHHSCAIHMNGTGIDCWGDDENNLTNPPAP